MPFIGKQPQAGAYSKLDAITTSATATYNLTLDSGAYYPQSANHLLVSLNGVIQAPQDSFTVSGSQIIFDSALTNADVIDFIIALGDTLDIGVPSAGSVNTSQLANDAVTTAKIAAGQVTSAKLDTNIAITGDLTVDTNTLHVDSANNKVGLGIDPGTLPSFVNHAALISNGGGISVTSASAGDNRYIFFGNGTSSSDIQLAAIQNTNSDLIFKGASGSEKMRILNAGGITFNGDTAAANALDDYEEGTWTPVIVASGGNPSLSYGAQNGTYTKIGRYVYTTFFIQINGVSSQGAGNLRIGPLPFTLSTANGFAAENGAIFYDMSGIGQTINYATGRGIGTDQILLTNLNTSGAAQSLNTGALNSNYVIGSYAYITDV